MALVRGLFSVYPLVRKSAGRPARPVWFEVRGEIRELRRLAAKAWPLGAVAQQYVSFLQSSEAIARALQPGKGLSDEDAIIARVLLIHEYRRIVLRDPFLPAEVLPGNWPGHAARTLAAGLYRNLLPPSERWLDVHGVAESGERLPPPTDLDKRFSGF